MSLVNKTRECLPSFEWKCNEEHFWRVCRSEGLKLSRQLLWPLTPCECCWPRNVSFCCWKFSLTPIGTAKPHTGYKVHCPHQVKCTQTQTTTEQHRRSFLPVAIKLYNSSPFWREDSCSLGHWDTLLHGIITCTHFFFHVSIMCNINFSSSFGCAAFCQISAIKGNLKDQPLQRQTSSCLTAFIAFTILFYFIVLLYFILLIYRFYCNSI